MMIALCAHAFRVHCLFAGPPGVGKTFLADLISENQRSLGKLEAAELALIQGEDLPLLRPVRKPHHSATLQSFTGGSRLNIGELGRAHTGILFLDEIAEFPHSTLEALREPLDDGAIRLSRAKGQITYPAHFQLLSTMNPCSCGYHFHPQVPCRCPPAKMKSYLGKLGGPLLDRLHILVWLEPTFIQDSGANAVASLLLMTRKDCTDHFPGFHPAPKTTQPPAFFQDLAPLANLKPSPRTLLISSELVKCLESTFPDASPDLIQKALPHLSSFRKLLVEAQTLG